MKAEEKVKQVYPNAWYRIAGPSSAEIKTGDPEQRRIVIFYNSRNRRSLWAEAWKRVQAEKEAPDGK